MMKQLPLGNPLNLTTANYWQQLEELATSGKMPRDLTDTLKSLVSSHIGNAIGPEAKYPVVRMAREHLKDGILLIDSAGELLYDVVVFLPDKPDDDMRNFFYLVRRWPGGQLHYLESLVSL
jgi:hypothetical protein